jgi:hypothetical protein
MTLLKIAVLVSLCVSAAIAQDCTVVFNRPGKYFGSLHSASVHVDGKLVGKVKNGRLINVTASAGRHTICADHCGETGRDYPLEPGIHYFRIDTAAVTTFHGAWFKTAKVPEEIAREELIVIKPQ